MSSKRCRLESRELPDTEGKMEVEGEGRNISRL